MISIKPTDFKTVDEIIEYVKNKYPVGIWRTGYFTEEEWEKIEKHCKIKCVQPHMNGVATYDIWYKEIRE